MLAKMVWCCSKQWALLVRQEGRPVYCPEIRISNTFCIEGRVPICRNNCLRNADCASNFKDFRPDAISAFKHVPGCKRAWHCWLALLLRSVRRRLDPIPASSGSRSGRQEGKTNAQKMKTFLEEADSSNDGPISELIGSIIGVILRRFASRFNG